MALLLNLGIAFYLVLTLQLSYCKVQAHHWITLFKTLLSLKEFLLLRGQFDNFEELEKTGKSDYQAERRRTRCRNQEIDYDSDLTSANECVLSCRDQFRTNTFFAIVDQSQLILALDKRTDASRMLSNRFRFHSKLGGDTANIDDMRIAGEKLAVVYSNDIEEDSVGSETFQFSNFVKLCVDEKQGDEAHETFIHRLIQERNLISLFPNIAIILLRIYLCIMCSNSSGERLFSKLKGIKNELRSLMSQRRFKHLSLMSIESELLRKQNYCKLIHEFACKKAREVLLKFKCLSWWKNW